MEQPKPQQQFDQPGRDKPTETFTTPGFLGFVDKGGISIIKPMSFWVGVLVLGLVLTFALAPTVKPGQTNYFESAGKFILYQPGAIILPLLVSVWMSAKIGAFKPGAHVAWKTALINAVYIAVIYAIAIFIIYLIGNYFGPGVLPSFTLDAFALNVIIIPVAIVLAAIPVLTILSAARHNAV